jgi:branched-chain amino acid transport system substrate-binding protein
VLRIPVSTKARVVGAALAIAATVAVAGCGGDDTGNAQSDDAVVGKKVKVVVTGPLSGEGAFAAPIARDAEAYFRYINDQGGVNGYTFDVKVLDNEITATGGARTAKEALRSKPLAMMIGGSAPFGGAASVIKAEAPTLPVFAVADAGVIGASKLRNAYGLQADYARECGLMAEYARKKLGLASVAILWQTNAVGEKSGATCPGFAKRQGFSKVTSISVAFDTKDFGSVAAKLKASGAQAVITVLSQTVLAGAQKAAQAVGYKGQWMGFNGADGAYVQVAGSLAEGLIAPNALEPLNADTPTMRIFREQVAKRVGKTGLVGIGQSGWTMAAIIVRGVRDATADGKSLTQASFVAAVNGLRDQQIGVAPSVSYAGADHTTIAKALTIYAVRNQQFIPIAKNQPVPAL